MAMKNRMAGIAVIALAMAAGSALAKGDASWMKGSVGVSAHWTPECVRSDGSSVSYGEMVDHFDTEAFAETLKNTGAQHCIFTLAHEYQMLPCPNAALDAIDPGRTSRRDLLGELIQSLKKRGIRFIAYYNHGCNNGGVLPGVRKWMEACGYPGLDTADGTMERFATNICAIVRDLSMRYGKGIDGWWFDSCPSIDTTGFYNFSGSTRAFTFPWADLLAAARSGNPDSAIALNPGVGKYYLYTDDVDYYAGESIRFDEPFICERRDDIVDTRWITADSLGWLYSSHCWNHGGFIPPRQSAQGFAAYIAENRAAGRMTTFNVLIDADGNFSPRVIRTIAKAIRGERSPYGRMDETRFNIGTYCLAPYARDEEHISDIHECGIDFVMGVPHDDRVLDLFAKYGLGAIVSGELPGWWGGDGSNAGGMAEKNPIGAYEKAAAEFRDHEAIWGLDVGDEPSAKDFPHYGKVVDYVNGAFPNQFAFLNLYPNYASAAENSGADTVNQLGTATYAEHIAEYVKWVKTPYICYDFYIYSINDEERMFDNFRTVTDACHASGRAFWYVAQVNSSREGESMSEDQLRYQAHIAMAYGAETLLWACWTKGWWYDNVLDETGGKTAQYEKLRNVNRGLRELGAKYMKYRNVATRFETADDGTRLVVGEMVARDGSGGKAELVVRTRSPYTAELRE